MKKSGSDKATNKWNSIQSTTKILIRALFLPGIYRHATRWNANSTEMNIHFECKSLSNGRVWQCWLIGNEKNRSKLKCSIRQTSDKPQSNYSIGFQFSDSRLAECSCIAAQFTKFPIDNTCDCVNNCTVGRLLSEFEIDLGATQLEWRGHA